MDAFRVKLPMESAIETLLKREADYKKSIVASFGTSHSEQLIAKLSASSLLGFDDDLSRLRIGLDRYILDKQYGITDHLQRQIRDMNKRVAETAANLEHFTSNYNFYARTAAQELSILGTTTLFARIDAEKHRWYNQQKISDPLVDQYRRIVESVESIVTPVRLSDLTEMLGSKFDVSTLYGLSNPGDVKKYLSSTNLPEEFVTASQPIISASLRDLRLVLPVRQVTNNQSVRQQKKIQLINERVSLWEALQRFEILVRARIVEVMTKAHGDDWAKKSTNPMVKGWSTKLRNQETSGWRKDFVANSEVEKSQFSELIKFAFQSAECSQLFVVDTSVTSNQCNDLIQNIVLARNSRQHYNEHTTPETRTIVFGFLVQLAMIAGIKIREDHERIDPHAT
jgi:hypothetical protein